MMCLTLRGLTLCALMFGLSVPLAAEDDRIAQLRRAAEQGDAAAQFNLGFAYLKGEGVPQDYAEAVKWWRRADEQGLAPAQYNLGLMYYKGEGIPQDYAEALKWYRRAAEQGNVRAQFYLGVMYAKGEGIPQDYVAAHTFFNLAGAKGYEDARKQRDRIASRMTAAQIAEAQRRARAWTPKTSP